MPENTNTNTTKPVRGSLKHSPVNDPVVALWQDGIAAMKEVNKAEKARGTAVQHLAWNILRHAELPYSVTLKDKGAVTFNTGVLADVHANGGNAAPASKVAISVMNKRLDAMAVEAFGKSTDDRPTVSRAAAAMIYNRALALAAALAAHKYASADYDEKANVFVLNNVRHMAGSLDKSATVECSDPQKRQLTTFPLDRSGYKLTIVNKGKTEYRTVFASVEQCIASLAPHRARKPRQTETTTTTAQPQTMFATAKDAAAVLTNVMAKHHAADGKPAPLPELGDAADSSTVAARLVGYVCDAYHAAAIQYLLAHRRAEVVARLDALAKAERQAADAKRDTAPKLTGTNGNTK